MSQDRFEIGDFIWFKTKGWEGHPGVVSQTVSKIGKGHALVCQSGQIIGIPVTLEDIALVEERHEGYVQLAFGLLALGNQVIEKKVLPRR